MYFTIVNFDNFILRLKTILDHYNLTSSTFADTIDVQRSSMSHLMSGRNKPSLDFVLKIVDKFPEVDLYWLLNGEGTFPKKNNEAEKNNNLTQKYQPKKAEIATPSLFEQTEQKDEVVSNMQFSERLDTTKKIKKVILLYEDGSFDEYNK